MPRIIHSIYLYNIYRDEALFNRVLVLRVLILVNMYHTLSVCTPSNWRCSRVDLIWVWVRVQWVPRDRIIGKIQYSQSEHAVRNKQRHNRVLEISQHLFVDATLTKRLVKILNQYCAVTTKLQTAVGRSPRPEKQGLKFDSSAFPDSSATSLPVTPHTTADVKERHAISHN